MDIQPVFNHYKAVAYMCAYLSKSKDECSQVMSQALKESFEDNLDNYQQMKSVALTYAHKRECSVQECAYQVLSGQWLRKTFPGAFLPIQTFQKKEAGFVPKKRKYISCQRIQEIFSKEYD